MQRFVRRSVNEQLTVTPAQNMAFKITMPHSQARVPTFLENKDVQKKPTQVLRKNVHSYFNPNLFEIVRENFKQSMSESLQYQPLFANPQRNSIATESAYGGYNSSMQGNTRNRASLN